MCRRDRRNTETGVRYWALPGQEGYMHILGGLEKDSETGAISTEPENHNLMCRLRAEKIAKIPVPDVKVQGLALIHICYRTGWLRIQRSECKR